jgi:hypothetical protein
MPDTVLFLAFFSLLDNDKMFIYNLTECHLLSGFALIALGFKNAFLLVLFPKQCTVDSSKGAFASEIIEVFLCSSWWS